MNFDLDSYPVTLTALAVIAVSLLGLLATLIWSWWELGELERRSKDKINSATDIC